MMNNASSWSHASLAHHQGTPDRFAAGYLEAYGLRHIPSLPRIVLPDSTFIYCTGEHNCIHLKYCSILFALKLK